MIHGSYKQKNIVGGIVWTIITVVLIFIVLGGIWFFLYNNRPVNKNSNSINTASTINSNSNLNDNANSNKAILNDSDLQAASSDLDNSNIDDIDNELDQNDTDAALF